MPIIIIIIINLALRLPCKIQFQFNSIIINWWFLTDTRSAAKHLYILMTSFEVISSPMCLLNAMRSWSEVAISNWSACSTTAFVFSGSFKISSNYKEKKKKKKYVNNNNNNLLKSTRYFIKLNRKWKLFLPNWSWARQPLSSARSTLLYPLLLNAKQGSSNSCLLTSFGMTRPGFERKGGDVSQRPKSNLSPSWTQQLRKAVSIIENIL